MVLTTALSVCGMQRYTRQHIVIHADPILSFWYQFLNYKLDLA